MIIYFYVICFDKVNKNCTTFGEQNINKVFKYKNNKKVFQLNTVGFLPLELTEGHKVRVTSDLNTFKWVSIEDLQGNFNDKYVIIPKKNNLFNEKDFSYLDLSSELRTHHMNKKINFNLQLNEDDAFLLGLLFAEGSFTNKGIHLTFGYHEKSLQEKVVNILESWGCENIKVREYKKKNARIVSISNVVLYDVLKKEFNGLSKTRKVPSCIMESKNKNIVKNFILGWYAGDGTHNTTRKLQHINTVSKIGALQLQLLGLKLGFVLSISKNVNNNYIARKVNALPLYRITLPQAFLYFLGLLPDLPKNKNPKIKENEKFFFLPITDVIDTKKIPKIVYDAETSNAELTVPYIVHNSKSISNASAHNQRSVAKVTVEIKEGKFLDIKEIINLVENNVSCSIYSTLKRDDEKYVTEYAYANPKFVEDVARDLAIKFDTWLDNKINDYVIVVEHYESIHKHNAVAIISAGRNLC